MVDHPHKSTEIWNTLWGKHVLHYRNLFGSALMPLLSIMYPRNLTDSWLNKHLSGFKVTASCSNFLITCSNLVLCSTWVAWSLRFSQIINHWYLTSNLTTYPHVYCNFIWGWQHFIKKLHTRQGNYYTLQTSYQDPQWLYCQVKQFCNNGCPAKHQLDPEVRLYWKMKESLTAHDKLLLFNNHIVVPPSLKQVVLSKIHMDIERCRMRVRESVWWPGVTSQMAQMVQNCSKKAHCRKEPMLKSDLPDYPWQVVGADLFEIKGVQYLRISYRLFLLVPRGSKADNNFLQGHFKLRDVFGRDGILEVLWSDPICCSTV